MPDRIQFESTLNEIRTSDAVVVLGAGASFMAGMPLADQLAPLLWHALDAHPNVLREVCSILRITLNTAKNAIGDDSNRISIAFAQIAADSDARRTFQRSFAILNRERVDTPSVAHIALARLLHAGRVLRVVSLNWDTLLETAFIQRYGIGINTQGTRLWKPHGDCSRPDDEWVLPCEPGFIPEAIVEELTKLAAQRPRVLLIIGYSESDDIVVKQLIHPLAERWRVFRINPDATAEGAIRLDAPHALRPMANALCPEPDVFGWDFVTFGNQRGLAAALAGERLGPQDVDVCPRLPHYESARRNLELLHMVDIAGLTGCGKSITAWHLAREYNLQGWEVLRLASGYSLDDDMTTQAIGLTSWKRILVVDDTQTLPTRFIRRLNELAGPNLKVILTTTDTGRERSRSVRIPAKTAVETLSSEFRRRRDEVLPIVRRFDSHVGDEYAAIPIERRIEDAGKSDTPWQFAFVLRGGWRQAREHMDSLRDFNRADLLLVIIAARQLLSLDTGTVSEELIRDAREIGYPGEWVRTGIDLLRQQGAILPTGQLRCLHLRSAAVIIGSSLKDRRQDTFPLVIGALRRLIADFSSPIRGVCWLLEEVLGAGAFLYRNQEEEGFFPPLLLEKLLSKTLSSSEPSSRRDAAFLLSRLLWYRELNEGRFLSEFPVLTHWVESATGEDAYAIGSLLNSIHNSNKAVAKQLVSSISPETIWNRVELARPTDGYVWGYYLGRLATAGGDEWRARMKSILPQASLLRFVRNFQSSDLEDLAEFIGGVASFDFDFGLECLKQTNSIIQIGFADDALNAYNAVRHLQMWVLGHGLFGESRPKKVQLNLSRQITNGILPERVARGIVTCRFGDWETYARLLDWVRKVNQSKHREIVDALDWDQLDTRSSAFWKSPCREFRLLLSRLIIQKDGQPVREWVAQRSERICEIDPILTRISPEAAISVVQKGGRVNLGGHNESDWKTQAGAVARVAQIDPLIAVDILEANRDHIVKHLSAFNELDVEEFPQFLELVFKLAPSLLAQFCNAVDPRSAAEQWPNILRGHQAKVRRGARRVIQIISQNGCGEIKELANKLLVSPHSKR